MEEYRPSAVDAVRMRTLEAYTRTRQTVALRSEPLRKRIAALWAVYKPTTYVGWTAFAGLALLSVSAASASMNILMSVALTLSWIGVFVWAVIVSCSTAGSLMFGTANFFFSATCAIAGTSILCTSAAMYAAVYGYQRARVYGQTYYASLPSSRAGQSDLAMRSLPAGQPATPSPTCDSSNSQEAHATIAAVNGSAKSGGAPAFLKNLAAAAGSKAAA